MTQLTRLPVYAAALDDLRQDKFWWAHPRITFGVDDLKESLNRIIRKCFREFLKRKPPVDVIGVNDSARRAREKLERIPGMKEKLLVFEIRRRARRFVEWREHVMLQFTQHGIGKKIAREFFNLFLDMSKQVAA